MRSGSQWGRFFLTHALSQKEPSPLTPFLEDPMTEIYRFRKTGEKQPESLDYLKKALAIRFPDATIEVYKDDRGRPLTDREDLWVSASHTGEWVFCGLSDEPLGIDASRLLCRMLDVGEGILIAEGGDRCYIRVYDQAMFDQLHDMLARTNDPFIDHPDISIMTDEDHAQVFKYSLWIEGGVPEDIKRSLPEGYRETTMGDATEFTQVEHTKATALDAVRKVLEARNGTTYRTMALGDSGNDIPMLHAADVGICMGNGTDAAKAAADYVTSAITEDGLLHAFEHFGLV